MRRARILVGSALLVVVASLLGLVAWHVSLAQGQFRLEQLRSRAAAEQDRYERLRLHAAELESPSRIVSAAHERLGMVPPPSVTYLSPPGRPSGQAVGQAAAGKVAAGKVAAGKVAAGKVAAGKVPAPRGEPDTGDDWSSVKRQLTRR